MEEWDERLWRYRRGAEASGSADLRRDRATACAGRRQTANDAARRLAGLRLGPDSVDFAPAKVRSPFARASTRSGARKERRTGSMRAREGGLRASPNAIRAAPARKSTRLNSSH